MRGRNLLWLTVLVPALAGAGCGSASAGDYEIVSEDGANVTLLVTDATKDTAKAAIKAYLDTNTGASDSAKYLDIQVVKTKDASTYVCSSRYFADKRTAAERAGNPDLAPSGYPAFTMNCP